MCPDPLEEVLYFFFWPKFAWKTWSAIIGVLGIVYLLTGHPTFTDVINEQHHIIHWLQRYDFNSIPNYYIVTGMIIASAITVIVATIKGIREQKEWDKTTWIRHREIMMKYPHNIIQAESDYYGDITN